MISRCLQLYEWCVISHKELYGMMQLCTFNFYLSIIKEGSKVKKHTCAKGVGWSQSLQMEERVKNINQTKNMYWWPLSKLTVKFQSLLNIFQISTLLITNKKFLRNISPPKNKVMGEFQVQFLSSSKICFHVNSHKIKSCLD